MNRTTTISWGTVLSGLIALTTAVLIALVHVFDVSIPWRTTGPGVVITIGVLILLAGLLIVFRPRRGASSEPPRPPASGPGTSAGAPAGAPAGTTAEAAAGTPAGDADAAPMDSSTTDSSSDATVPAAQGVADDSATGVESNGDAAQSNH